MNIIIIIFVIIHNCVVYYLKINFQKKINIGGRENLDKLKNKLIPILLFFAIAITLCGTSAAATTTHTNNTNLTNSTSACGRSHNKRYCIY